MLRRLYLSPFGIVISFFLNLAGMIHRPFMVYGYWNRVTKRFNKLTRISSTVLITDKSKFNIGNNCWIWHYSIIDSSNGVTIGEGTQIGAWVGIFSHGSHLAIRLLGNKYIEIDKTDRAGYDRGPVEIGAYTFVGASSVIFPKVKIGKGCLIAAHTVVKKDVPDFAIVSGNPGEIVGRTTALDSRFFEDPKIRDSYFDQDVVADYLKRKAKSDDK